MSGLLLGGIYALVSIGLTLIYGTMDIINFAHGSFLMLSMYMSFWLWRLLGFDPYLTLPLATLTFFLIGWVVQRELIDRVLKAGLVSQLFITFGLMMVLENSALALWTVDTRNIRTAFSTMNVPWLKPMGIFILYPKLVAFIISLIVSAILYLFLTRTFLGLAIRSTAQNKEVASIVGVNIRTIYALTFAIGIALVGIAGALLSAYFPMTPYVGLLFLLPAFVVSVLGGLGNYAGAFFGGLIIGLVEVYAGFFYPQYKMLAYMAVFFIILLFRPYGLLGKEK
ncbi:MAG: branched-chain amino acid ABC transporter permease [Candidatus Geothermarchaeales archaeon]